MAARQINVLRLIERKRDGHALATEEIDAFIAAYTRGEVPDYQAAALLMAVYFRGMNSAETRALTRAMRDSGEILQFPAGAAPVVDKHSTGGIGDKVSLPLAPLLACLGFRMPTISGRGLGITGGTLDKLESIPGFRTALTRDEIISCVEKRGVAMAGQTERMCPADRLLYALRDVTGTVPSIPLITASILSKKLAEGISTLLLDVKFGTAAFMPTIEEGRELATTMKQIAEDSGVKTRALLTDMSSPLGRSAGNWLEVKESVECLDNRGPADLKELVLACAAHAMALTGKSRSVDEGWQRAEAVLTSGDPRKKWDEIVAGQGGDLDAFAQKLKADHTAPLVVEVPAAVSGWVALVDARAIGEFVRELGGGRLEKDEPIDSDVGIDRLVAVGDPVSSGGVLCRAHCRSAAQVEEAATRLASAFRVAPEPVPPRRLIAEVI